MCNWQANRGRINKQMGHAPPLLFPSRSFIDFKLK